MGKRGYCDKFESGGGTADRPQSEMTRPTFKKDWGWCRGTCDERPSLSNVLQVDMSTWYLLNIYWISTKYLLDTWISSPFWLAKHPDTKNVSIYKYPTTIRILNNLIYPTIHLSMET